jgi:N-acetyl-alpha-D-muramate 1-phosphate uridylyltransferase
MILAAGRGERMGVLTEAQPKPLLEVSGEPLIVHHLRALARAGITDVVINLSYRGAQIEERLGRGERWGVSVRYSREGEPPLETAGGIVHALALLGRQPFVLVSADVLTAFDFASLSGAEAQLSARGWQGLLVMVPNPTHHPDGDFALAANRRLRRTGPRRTYSGIALFDPALFAGLRPGRRALRPVLEAAIDRGLLGGLAYDGHWIDIGTPERLIEARANEPGQRDAGAGIA